MAKGLTTKAFTLVAGIAVAASGASKASPQLTGDFSRSDCRQALQLAHSLSDSKGFEPQAAPPIPENFPSKLSLFERASTSDALDSDPAIFQRLDRPNFASKKLRHVYWQAAPYGKRLVITQKILDKKADLYQSHLLDPAVTADTFFDGYQDDVSRSLFRGTSSTPTSPELLTDKATGRLWDLERGSHTWSVFSLDENWTNYQCSIEFGDAEQKSKASWTDAARKRSYQFCKDPKTEPRILLCKTDLTEEERRERVWATFRDLKGDPKIDCRGEGNCGDLVTAFLARKTIEFDKPLLRASSLLDPRLLKILPAQMDSNLGKQLIEDGCGTRCAHFSRANGAVVVYGITSYKGSGLPALRMEFYGLRPENNPGSEPALRLIQIVDPITGAVAASTYDTDDTRIDSGFFRYGGVAYQYQIFRHANEGYIALTREGLETVKSGSGIWIEMK